MFARLEALPRVEEPRKIDDSALVKNEPERVRASNYNRRGNRVRGIVKNCHNGPVIRPGSSPVYENDAMIKKALTEARRELRPLLNALRFVESSNRLNVPDGDEGMSIGPLQISSDYHRDAWRHRVGPWPRCRELEHAEQTVIAYWLKYCPEAVATQDWEALAKTHNGGPNGPQREHTVYYWSKVLKSLKEQSIDIPKEATRIPPRRPPLFAKYTVGARILEDRNGNVQRQGAGDLAAPTFSSKVPPSKQSKRLFLEAANVENSSSRHDLILPTRGPPLKKEAQLVPFSLDEPGLEECYDLHDLSARCVCSSCSPVDEISPGETLQVGFLGMTPLRVPSAVRLSAAVTIQKYCRRWLSRRIYLRMLVAAWAN